MRLALVLALAMTLTGCDDSDGDPANYVAVGDMPKAYKAAYCTYLARCGLFPDQATCVSAALSVVPTIDPNLVAAVGAGRVLYNGSRVKACYDAVANDTCDETDANGRTHIAACGAFFIGTLLAGEDCFVDQECVSQRCSGDTDTSCTRGTCIGDTAPSHDLVPIGMACSSSPQCVDGAYCDFTTGTCTALRGSGDSCTGSSECGYGLACAGPTGSRTCQPLPRIGESCRLDLPCRDEGQICSTQTSTCVQVGLPGAPCTSSLECSPYYRCDFGTGMCAKNPSINESCSGSSRCFDADTFCDPNTLFCTATKIDGMPCTSDLQCASGYCDVDALTPVCATPPLCM
jgi:hypothetical protein